MTQLRSRVRKPPAERKEDILQAAAKVFADTGIAGSTIEDIANLAGVAKGTVYLYFDSKEMIVAALRDRFVEDSLAHAAELAGRVGKEDWWGLVDAVIDSQVSFFLERRDLIHIFWQESVGPETHDIFAKCEQRLNDLFAWGIKVGMDAGAFRSTDPELTAKFLHHAVEGSLVESILYGFGVEPERLAAGAKDLVRKVLAP